MNKMKYILEFKEFNNLSSDKYVWRNTNFNWLLELLTKKYINAERNRFISFSSNENSGGQDDFGGTRIKFNRKELERQGLVEIEYDTDFFKEHPDICLYVTAYKSKEDYYENLGYDGPDEANDNGELTWEDYIGDFEIEQELVLKEIKYTSKLIEEVTFIKDKPSTELIDILKSENIKYE